MKDNNKKSLIIFGVIAVIAVIVIICISIINNGNDLPEEGTTNIETNEPNEEYSLIDMENNDNVKIEDGIKTNISTELAKEKEYKGMKVTDIKLEAENGMTNFTAKVENNTENDFQGKKILIIFTNEDGSEYARLETYLADIEAGKSNIIDASTTSDMSNAYNFSIEPNE